MLSEQVHAKLQELGLIAVLVIDQEEDAVPLAKALLDGGVQAMELTLRTDAALTALRAIRLQVPEMLAGIGTILTTEQVDQVVEAKAEFGVSPGTNVQVIRHAQQRKLPFAPGVCTPTDVEAALALGCRSLKFFPAGPLGGLTYLRSMAAPYQHLGVQFVPLGGVNQDNMVEYLSDPLILAVGGSWLAPRDLIRAADWPAITRRAVVASAALTKMQRE